jgi:hypothetical protein
MVQAGLEGTTKPRPGFQGEGARMNSEIPSKYIAGFADAKEPHHVEYQLGAKSY